MSHRKTLLILVCLCAYITVLRAQKIKATYKFGSVTAKDFSPKSPAIDSGSNAVVLADIGSTDFEGNTRGYFTQIFKVHERILLKSRNAFEKATVNVTLYTGLAEFAERFDDFEASTYSLDNSQVKETKLAKTEVFKEKINKEFTTFKFTLPNIKEGSIIEYQYTIKSPFHNNNIRAWNFQGEYPSLWSEYKVTIPPIFNYAIIKQGYLPYAVDTTGTTFQSYSIISAGSADESSQVYNLSGEAKWNIWAMKDVPAFKEERYTSASKNFVSAVRFQLHSIRYSDTHTEIVMKDWFSTVDDLKKDPDFGKDLEEKNSWCDAELNGMTAKLQGLQKAKKIFEYVRDNYTCTDDDAKYLSQPIKKTWLLKKGNVADINLLLTAILNEQNFEAHPVLLSTRDNGRASEMATVINQFNYVIARVKVDSIYYLLDASVNRLGFGRLPQKCYNGGGRLIDNPPYLIPLSADSVEEAKTTLLFIVNDEKDGVSGSMTNNAGYYESLEIRDKIAKTKEADYIKQLVNSYPAGIEVSNIVIDSLKAYDQPVCIRHDVKLKFDEDIVYFNPIIHGTWNYNPFNVAQRSYPVEMPAKINETYVLNMEIPAGYKIDEVPQSVRIKLNENEGMFEYLLQKDANNLQFRYKLVLNKANFMPEDYQTLRDFFAFVVKKEAEQIVFKKKS